MTTFSASLTNLTALLPQSRDCSCFVSIRLQAPSPLWLQKHSALFKICILFHNTNFKISIPKDFAVRWTVSRFPRHGKPTEDKNEISKTRFNLMRINSAIFKQPEVTAIIWTHSKEYPIIGDNRGLHVHCWISAITCSYDKLWIHISGGSWDLIMVGLGLGLLYD